MVPTGYDGQPDHPVLPMPGYYEVARVDWHIRDEDVEVAAHVGRAGTRAHPDQVRRRPLVQPRQGLRVLQRQSLQQRFVRRCFPESVGQFKSIIELDR